MAMSAEYSSKFEVLHCNGDVSIWMKNSVRRKPINEQQLFCKQYLITVDISDFKFPNFLENSTLHFKDYARFTETIASSWKFNVQMQLVMLWIGKVRIIELYIDWKDLKNTLN